MSDLFIILGMLFSLEVQMYLRIYRVNEELPDYIIQDSLECNCVYDIDPGIYKRIDTILINYKNVQDLIEALENNEEEIYKFQVSDIVEMLCDEEMMNKRCGYDLSCNFLIKTSMCWWQIAIDKDSVFRELSMKELFDLFMIKQEIREK